MRPRTLDQLAAQREGARRHLRNAPDFGAVFAAGTAGQGVIVSVPADDPGNAGPLGQLRAQQDAVRAQLAGAPDLRGDLRKLVDVVWEKADADARRRFGRTPSRDPWSIEAGVVSMALQNVTAAEARFLQLAGASPAQVQVALDGFCEAVSQWLNVATANWPSAAELQAQEVAGWEGR